MQGSLGMNRTDLVSLGSLLAVLVGCGGEGGTGPAKDLPPTVTIQQVLLEGYDPAELRVIGTATDDKGLDSLRFSVNGVRQF